MRKLADGFVMLTSETAKALLSIREEIFNTSKITYSAKEKEIIRAAYAEVQTAMGNHTSRLEGCEQCFNEPVRILRNWIKMYDERGRVDQLRINPPEVKKLQPLKERQELKPKEVKKETIEEVFKEILDSTPEGVEFDIDINTLTWPQLKSFASGLGIKVKGKKKDQILKELQDASK